MNEEAIFNFFKGSMLGIRPFLSFHYGLVHNDKESIEIAKRSNVKVKGIYSIIGYKDSPRVLSVYVQVSAGFLPIFVNNSEPLSMAAKLPANQKITARRGNDGVLCLEIPKPKNLCWIIAGPKLPLFPDSESIAIGMNVNGGLQKYDFSGSLTSHLFISGMTGSGKTILQKLILAQLARQNSPNNIRFLLADYGKAGFNFRDFDSINHLQFPVIKTLEDTYNSLAWMIGELNKRKTIDRNRLVDLPRIVLMIDEVQDIFNNSPDAINFARELVAKGREFKLSLILATQYTNGEYLGDTQILRNMARLVGKADSAQNAYLLSGIPNSGAETLSGNGDFLSIVEGNAERFQAALLTPSMVRGISKDRNRKIPPIPEYEQEADESTGNKRKTDIIPAMVAECLINNKYDHLRDTFEIGNTVARRIREYTNQLEIELHQRGYKISKR